MSYLKKLFSCLLPVCLALSNPLAGSAQVKTAKDSTETKQPVKKIKSYKEFITPATITDAGMFNIHHIEERYYFEIPDKLLRKDMLIISRRVAMSSSEIDPMVAGENAKDGIMVQWDKSPDGKFIFLKKVTTRNLIRYSGEDAAFKQGVELQTLDPILVSFPIVAEGANSSGSIIDIKPLYLTDVKDLAPFTAPNPLLVFLGVKSKVYKMADDRSYISTAKSFEKNIEVRSMFTYTEGDNNIYTTLINRSMVLLPETPMRSRYADERVGYFTYGFDVFNESRPVKSVFQIKRWRLDPKEEDEGKMKRGVLVEPKKPIILYIDAATPKKWIKFIKQGVEDWQPAFEEAGFKNAIIAREAPVNDPDFNPEDIRYSVIRYAASDIPNAKGPSVMDPRTGEILESDIILYHNVIKLLEDWRFSQTAANDPRVRTKQIDDQILGESLRYVVSHEVGHALGLRHNMGASYAFPVDSLRSASFTQKYGTTPSIMDYARNNYVAQPGDKGVKLTPPLLGVYDKYAIKWGYKHIPGTKNAEQEVDQLNKWIEAHYGDDNYRFREGDLNSSDPAALRESLGNDVIKASEYGVKNIRYIMSNLRAWLGEKGEKLDVIESRHQATLRQYERYLDQAGALIGGMYQNSPVQGQKINRVQFASKKDQQRAVDFILKQYNELPEWLGKDSINIVDNSTIVRRILPTSSYIERLYQGTFQRSLLNTGILADLIDNEVNQGSAAYTARNLLDNLRADFFKESASAQSAYYKQLLQSIYVDRLLALSKFNKPGSGSKSLVNEQQVSKFLSDSKPCFDLDDLKLASFEAIDPLNLNADLLYANTDLHYQIMDFRAADKQFKIESLIYEELAKIQAIVKKEALKDNSSSGHYNFLSRRINQFLTR